MKRIFAGLVLSCVLVALQGCNAGTDTYDFDGDGTVDSNDCGPEDPAIYPEAPDPVGDGVDSNCDGVDGIDKDGDGYASPTSGGDDCNDDDFNIHPGAEEIADDSIDQDCDGADLVCNLDGDSMTSVACGGQDCDDDNNLCTDNCDDADGDGKRICDLDCDDDNEFRRPGLTEVCDGLDNDCDLSTTTEPDELDHDNDGWLTCTGGFVDHGAVGAAGQAIVGSGDCDDEDGDRSPGHPELCDGFDNDCNGQVDENDPDEDDDGFAACLDCDDDDNTIAPGKPELCDGVDSDCVPATTAAGGETDVDEDEYMGCEGDCDDNDAEQLPGQFWYPDVDGDGFGNTNIVQQGCSRPPGYVTVPGDCDDEDPTSKPGNPEVCDGADNDCDLTLPPDEADADSDGFMPCTGDCADSNAARFPGNPEVCDALDNDCDLSVPADEVDGDSDGFMVCEGDCDDADPDEFPGQNWYVDLDGDGFGGGVPFVACAQPANTSTIGTDCDDGNPARWPGNPDVCDGIDNDCDLDVDQNDPDVDSDGFADCVDCDDDDDSRFPGAPELCNEVDDDCDGVLPAAEQDADSDTFLPCTGDCDDNDEDEFPGQTWYADGDVDTYGNLYVVYVSCERPSGYVTNSDDCDDDEATAFPDNPEVCDGLDNDCDGTSDDTFDDDGDGWSPCAIPSPDCADDDATRYPSAPELCDGLDNDCNAAVPSDELDSDSDGVRLCDGDCSDVDADRYPGNAEVCDLLDNDCVSATTAAGGETDVDQDQYLTCSPYIDHGALNTAGEPLLGGADCDDGEDARFPTNPEECDGFDNDCAAATTVPLGEVDGDSDRRLPCVDFVSNGATNADSEVLLGGNDCDDDDGLRFPTNPEVCDGIDNDCIGSTTVALGEDDVDGDQYMPCANFVDHGADNASGDPLLGGNDCTDAEADTFPGNPEVDDCDGFDNDCVLDGDEVDDDGDGWFECDGDCDDAADDAFPENPAEDACDGYDSDCVLDGDEIDDDGDGWFECAGDCDDGDASFSPGPWEDPDDGIDNDCNLTDGNGDEFAHAVVVGAYAGSRLGQAVGGAGDVDGDGLDDILVAAPFDSYGKVGLFTGAQLAAGGTLALTDASALITGGPVELEVGWSVSSAGDVDGDGLDDVLIGSRSINARCWLFFGSTLSAGGTFSTTTADVIFQNWSSASCHLASAGDVDGDGLADVLVGDWARTWFSSSFALRGRVWLHLGADLQAGGIFAPGDAHAELIGAEPLGSFGVAMAGGGDVDGDGLDDLFIGEPGASAWDGQAAMFLGSTLAPGGTFYSSSADAFFDFGGSFYPNRQMGYAVSMVDDVDGDGLDELIVGGSGTYESHFYLGSTVATGGPFSHTQADLTLDGSTMTAGVPLAGAGDVDGDGLGDLLVTAKDDSEGGSGAGRTFVVFGSVLAVPAAGDLQLDSTAAVTFVGEAADARSGTGVAGVGDVDGDGLDDLLIGAPGTGSDSWPGRAYLRLSPY